MSYPYISDLMFGSEMSAVGGNLPGAIVASVPSEETGPGEPDKIFSTNMVTVYRKVDDNWDSHKGYFMVDIESIEESEYKEKLKEVLRGLKLTIVQKFKAESPKSSWMAFNNDDANSSHHNLSAELLEAGWDITIDTNGHLKLTYVSGDGATGTLDIGFYLEYESGSVTDIYYDTITESSTEKYVSRNYTGFKDTSK